MNILWPRIESRKVPLSDTPAYERKKCNAGCVLPESTAKQLSGQKQIKTCCKMHRFDKKIDALRALACAAANAKTELPPGLRTAAWPAAFLETVDAWAKTSSSAAQIVSAAVELEVHSPTPTATPTGGAGPAAACDPIFHSSLAHVPLSQRVQLEHRHTYDALDLVRLWLLPLCSLPDNVWSAVWGMASSHMGEDATPWKDGKEYGVHGPMRECVAWRQFRRACNAAMSVVPSWGKGLPLLRRLVRGGAFAYPPPEDDGMSPELRTAMIRWNAAQRVLGSLREQVQQEWPREEEAGGGTEEERVHMALQCASSLRRAEASEQVAERSLLCTDAWNHVLDALTRDLNAAAERPR